MRKWQETVRPFPQLQRKQSYRVRVIDVRKDDEAKAMEVTFEFLAANQIGRQIAVFLSLPIRHCGLTADYFRACHIKVKPQAKICPLDTINCEILGCFEKAADGDSWQPIHFEPISQGEKHVPIKFETESPVHGPDL